MFKDWKYPEVNVKVSAIMSELSVSNLECDSHFVVAVELFVEAFFRVRFHLDVVTRGETETCEEDRQDAKSKKRHFD